MESVEPDIESVEVESVEPETKHVLTKSVEAEEEEPANIEVAEVVLDTETEEEYEEMVEADEEDAEGCDDQPEFEQLVGKLRTFLGCGRPAEEVEGGAEAAEEEPEVPEAPADAEDPQVETEEAGQGYAVGEVEVEPAKVV